MSKAIHWKGLRTTTKKLTYQDLLIGTRSIKGNIHIISFEFSHYNNSLESGMLSQAPGSHLFEM